MRTIILAEANRLQRRIGSHNPFWLADYLNIDVWQRPLGNLKGLYIYYNLSRYICINDSLDEHMRRLVCAHEIGHDRFHRQLAKLNPQAQDLISYDMSSRLEREANLFAAEFLLSDDDVIEVMNDEDTNFFLAARKLCVPPELLDFKFQILKSRGYRFEAPLYAGGDFLKR